MQYSICETSLRTGTFAADVALASECGATAVALMEEDLLYAGVAEAHRILDDSGLAVSSLMGVQAWPTDGGDIDQEALKGAFDRAAGVGAPGVLVLAGYSRYQRVQDADDELLRRLELAADVARPLGLAVYLEPVHPVFRPLSHVHTLGHAARLARQVQSVLVTVDTGHVWWDPDIFDAFEANIDLIATVQLSDVSVAAEDLRRYRRVQLGTGDVPFSSLLPSFVTAGFTGYFENEVNVNVPAEDRAAFLRQGRAVIEGALGSQP